METTVLSLDNEKTIEQLDGVIWPEPALQSYVATASFALRRKTLGALTPEDLRLGLEQQVGVEYLMPLALELLEQDPLTEARLYPGDLLQSLLDIPQELWVLHADWRARAGRVTECALRQAAECAPNWRAEILPVLQEAYDRFLGKRPSRPWLRANWGSAAPGIAA